MSTPVWTGGFGGICGLFRDLGALSLPLDMLTFNSYLALPRPVARLRGAGASGVCT